MVDTETVGVAGESVRVKEMFARRGSCQLLLVETRGHEEVWVVDELLWSRNPNVKIGCRRWYEADWLSRVVLARFPRDQFHLLSELGLVSTSVAGDWLSRPGNEELRALS